MKLRLGSPQKETGATTYVDLVITNEDIQSIGGPDELRIEMTLPRAMAHPAILAAGETAAQNDNNLALLPDIATLSGGRGLWIAWARTASSPEHVSIWLRNDVARDGRKVAPLERGALGRDEALYLRLPLAATRQRTHLELQATFRARNAQQDADLELWVLPEGAPAPPPPPIVFLESNQESPTALLPGTVVEISWRVDRAISGKLLGPLAGRIPVVTLEDDTPFPLSRGSIRVRAVGQATYLLQAIVDDAGVQVQIIRTLVLDVFTPNQYAAVQLVPVTVLPFGHVDVYWAAWGVTRATIRVGQDFTRTVLGTTSASTTYLDGDGILPVRVEAKGLPVRLEYESKTSSSVGDKILVVNWKPVGVELPLRVGPVHSAAVVSDETTGHLCVCGPDSILALEVGARDERRTTTGYVKLALPGKRLGLVGLSDSFVVLRRADSALELVRFTVAGEPLAAAVVGTPVTMPGTAAPRGMHDEPEVRIAAIGTRVYLAIGRSGRDGVVPEQAWSIDLNAPLDGWSPEPMLRGFYDCQLATLGGALYALHRKSGGLYRIEPSDTPVAGGTLSVPRRAAPAVDGKSKSLVERGVPVAVDQVLVVLGSGQTSSPEDHVYNPQTDRWTPCGQDPQVRNPRVVACRGGDSVRLWAMTGEELFTLAAGGLRLFARDFLAGNPPWVVPEIDSRSFVVRNATPFTLEPADAGLAPTPLSGSLVHVDAPSRLTPGGSGSVTVWMRDATAAASGSWVWRVAGIELDGQPVVLAVDFSLTAGGSGWTLTSRSGTVPSRGRPAYGPIDDIGSTEMVLGSQTILYQLIAALGVQDLSGSAVGEVAEFWGLDVDLEAVATQLAGKTPKSVFVYADTVRAARTPGAVAALERQPLVVAARLRQGNVPANGTIPPGVYNGEGAYWRSTMSLLQAAMVTMEPAPATAALMGLHVADRAKAPDGVSAREEWLALGRRAEALALNAATLSVDVFTLGLSRQAEQADIVGDTWGETTDRSKFNIDANRFRTAVAEDVQMWMSDRGLDTAPRKAMLAAIAPVARGAAAWSTPDTEQMRLLLLAMMAFDVVLAAGVFAVRSETLTPRQGERDVFDFLAHLQSDTNDLLPFARDRFDRPPASWPMFWHEQRKNPTPETGVPGLLRDAVRTLTATERDSRSTTGGVLAAMRDVAVALGSTANLQQRISRIVGRAEQRGGMGRLSAAPIDVESEEMRALIDAAGHESAVAAAVAALIRYRSESARLVEFAIGKGLDGARALKAARAAVLWDAGHEVVRWTVLLRLLAQWTSAYQWDTWATALRRHSRASRAEALQDLEQKRARLDGMREWSALHAAWLRRPSAITVTQRRSLAEILAAAPVIGREVASRLQPAAPWIAIRPRVEVPVSLVEAWDFDKRLFVEIGPDDPALAAYVGVIVRSVQISLHGVERADDRSDTTRVLPPTLCVRRDEHGSYPFQTMRAHKDLEVAWDGTVATLGVIDLSDRPFFSPFGIWQINLPSGTLQGLSRVVLQFEGAGMPFEPR